MAKALPVSPLAPAAFPDLPQIAGVEFAAIESGVRYRGRRDVMLARLAPGSAIAGVFTRSATRSAPVLDCEAKLAAGGDTGAGAAILVNSGNANAFTGAAGEGSVAAICSALATAAGLPASRIFTASTGVIGERLPHERIIASLDALVAGLAPDATEAAARAIMTTDTFAKGAGAVVPTPAGEIHIAGFAKGSGMIAPDMATMLVYIFTDARVPQPLLQRALSAHTETTFNAITVDGDTSTSDSLMLAATGQGPVVIDDLAAGAGPAFTQALHSVMLDLAQQVVRDGEGASKFVEIRVTGAVNAADAKRTAMAIANSPLVKTAIAGEDPNWGRVVMAVGKSGAKADRDRLSIRFGDVLVAEKGWVAESYTEEAGAAYMKRAELQVNVDLGLGNGAFTAWTCDLTHGYISINADYRS
ncbi:MAG: bifunctional glutamate N-acetyltransferase/amino-acid acetyltransferase ArgJ [Tropicimonas sp.]|uniref:bifunctional glutamate N-acetyltransferase/amino-acid acetyltransferase ArgJ n=1 Tax=Tropicimonas sp. TaxID=2067044 RepID=UPI003A83B121